MLPGQSLDLFFECPASKSPAQGRDGLSGKVKDKFRVENTVFFRESERAVLSLVLTHY